MGKVNGGADLLCLFQSLTMSKTWLLDILPLKHQNRFLSKFFRAPKRPKLVTVRENIEGKMPILKVQPIASRDPRRDLYPVWHRLLGRTTEIVVSIIISSIIKITFLLSWFSPSFSVSSVTDRAFGKSCLFAKTKTMASRSSSSLSWKNIYDVIVTNNCSKSFRHSPFCGARRVTLGYALCQNCQQRK